MRSSFGCSLNSFVARSGCREQICLYCFSVRHQSRTTPRKGWEGRRDEGERTLTVLSLLPQPNSSCVSIQSCFSSLCFSSRLSTLVALSYLFIPPLSPCCVRLFISPVFLHPSLLFVNLYFSTYQLPYFHVFFLPLFLSISPSLHEMHMSDCPTLTLKG